VRVGQLCAQCLDAQRLGQHRIHAGGLTCPALVVAGVRRERHDRAAAPAHRCLQRPQLARGLQAIHVGHLHDSCPSI